MLTAERQGIILDEIEKNGSVTVGYLCEVLGASESTVRRDLSSLESAGKLKKVHGGALAAEGKYLHSEAGIEEKISLNSEEKDLIARYAAQTVNKNDTVFIDAGTTTEKMAEYITEQGALYVTNGFDAAQILAKKGLRVYLTGGRVKASTGALTGAACVETLKNFNFTKAFLGTNGVSVNDGLTTPDAEEAYVKRTAAEKSYITYVLCDHTKFNVTAAVTFAECRNVCIITDRLSDSRYAKLTVVKEVSQ